VVGTGTNALGLAGQNSPTPAQKIFGSHNVLRYTTSAGNDILLDPSYGLAYANASVFWQTAVAGFARQSAASSTNRLVLEVMQVPQ